MHVTCTSSLRGFGMPCRPLDVQPSFGAIGHVRCPKGVCNHLHSRSRSAELPSSPTERVFGGEQRGISKIMESNSPTHQFGATYILHMGAGSGFHLWQVRPRNHWYLHCGHARPKEVASNAVVWRRLQRKRQFQLPNLPESDDSWPDLKPKWAVILNMSQFKRNIKKPSTPTSPQNWRITFELRNLGVALDHRGRTKKGCLCLKDLKAIVQFVWQQLQSEILLGAFNSGSNYTHLYSKPSAFGASDTAPGCVRINRRLIV